MNDAPERSDMGYIHEPAGVEHKASITDLRAPWLDGDRSPQWSAPAAWAVLGGFASVTVGSTTAWRNAWQS
jgi:hypothetical protein